MAGWGVLGVVVGLVGIGYLLTRKEKLAVQTRKAGFPTPPTRLPSPPPAPTPPSTAQAMTGEVVEVVKLRETLGAKRTPAPAAQLAEEQDVAGWSTGFAGEGGDLAGLWGDA